MEGWESSSSTVSGKLTFSSISINNDKMNITKENISKEMMIYKLRTER